MPAPIDLRSDTVTRPTEAMRRAMAAADVGDDVYGEDPTVNALQERVADLFGCEAALFVPSGSMANRVWLGVLAPAGSEVIVEAQAHHVAFEAGAAAMFNGVQWHTVAGERGQLSASQVREAVRPTTFPWAQTSAVSVEQTTNYGGGTVYSLEALEAIREVADEAGIALHVDGARVFNAVVATGTDPAAYAALADGLNFCFSKGLGAPIGSILVGDAAGIEEAHTWRHRFGGAMRQVGVLAAAALHALDHHVERLADDHAHARMIAERVEEVAPGSVDLDAVQTNIVYLGTGDRDAGALAGQLRDQGVLLNAMGPDVLRVVTHLDVDDADCQRAADLLAGLLAGPRR